MSHHISKCRDSAFHVTMQKDPGIKDCNPNTSSCDSPRKGIPAMNQLFYTIHTTHP